MVWKWGIYQGNIKGGCSNVVGYKEEKMVIWWSKIGSIGWMWNNLLIELMNSCFYGVNHSMMSPQFSFLNWKKSHQRWSIIVDIPLFAQPHVQYQLKGLAPSFCSRSCLSYDQAILFYSWLWGKGTSNNFRQGQWMLLTRSLIIHIWWFVWQFKK